MSIYGALATATRALETYSTAVQVAGNNIANANTPGYIREEINLVANRPSLRGALLIGTGVQAESVRQSLDQYLEKRIHAANSDVTASQAKGSIYKQLELELRELGNSDLSSRMSEFVNTLNEVVNQPEQTPLRNNVIEQGKLLAGDIKDLRFRLDRLREQQTTRIDDLVTEANSLIDQVQSLNKSIAGLESNGLITSQAGALRSQRYQALNRLSEIMPINFNEGPNGVVDIYSGSDYVLLSNRSQHLQTQTFSDRGVVVQTVEFDRTHKVITQDGGELKGVFEARDETLGGFLDQLDQLTRTVIFEFNRLHSSGEGLDGYTTTTSEHSINDPSVSLSQSNIPFKPVHGSFVLKLTNKQTGISETHRITLDQDGIGGNDTTFEGLRNSIDAIDHIDASITTLGKLKIDADPNYEFRFSNDSSGVLAALGINSFFQGVDSRTIDVRSEIASNVRLFAAGTGGGPADNTNAIRLTQFLDTSVSSLGNTSLSSFYDGMVSRVAQGSAKEDAETEGFETFRSSLLSQRDQFSGVSIDEEAVHLIEAQQAFAASARVITTIDELIQTILNI